MPFHKNARIEIENQTEEHITVFLTVAVDRSSAIPSRKDHGYFQATWTGTVLQPDVGKKSYPHIILTGAPGQGILSTVVWQGTKDNATDPSQFGTIILQEQK